VGIEGNVFICIHSNKAEPLAHPGLILLEDWAHARYPIVLDRLPPPTVVVK